MKGLLIKDFSLLKKQKIFFLIILIQGVAFFGFGEQEISALPFPS